MKAILLTITLAANVAQALPDSPMIEYYAAADFRCHGEIWQVRHDEQWYPVYDENGQPMECEQ